MRRGSQGDTDATALAAIAERAWQFRLDHEPHLRTRLGLAVERLPVGSLPEAEQAAAFAADLIRSLKRVDASSLSPEDSLTHAFLKDDLSRMQEESSAWWWQFGVTPYSAMPLGSYLRSVFEPFDFGEAEAAERYCSLVHDYARIVHGLRHRVAALADRGWILPRPALAGVRATLVGLRGAACQTLRPTGARIEPLRSAMAAWKSTLESVLGEVMAAFERLLEMLGDEYERRAPGDVGLHQYPDGEAAYRALVCRHATYEIDPESVHNLGLDTVDRLREEMRAVRAAIGYRGAETDFAASLAAAGKLYASTPEDVECRYRYHLARMAGVVGGFFSTTPRAPYDIARLDPALEAGLSYGYYELPTSKHPVGRYRYNGSGLDSRSQLSAAALIFHELVPGHHFHLARQSENLQLPAIRRESLRITAFVEGWAEYASDLARDMNLYDDPYDLYGRLVLDRFAAQRLVVDTGMNLLGWTLEQGRAYMKANTLESDTQVATETLRYATDLPGQALAYRLGFQKFRGLRERAQRALGRAFAFPRFHEAILQAGALPLNVLDQHIDGYIRIELAALRDGDRPNG